MAVLDNRKPVVREMVKHGKSLAETTGDPEPLEKVATVSQKFNETESKSHEKEAFLDKVSKTRYIVQVSFSGFSDAICYYGCMQMRYFVDLCRFPSFLMQYVIMDACK